MLVPDGAKLFRYVLYVSRKSGILNSPPPLKVYGFGLPPSPTLQFPEQSVYSAPQGLFVLKHRFVVPLPHFRVEIVSDL